MCYLWHFYIDATNEMVTNDVFVQQIVTKCLKLHVKISSLRSCLLCVDSTLVNPLK